MTCCGATAGRGHTHDAAMADASAQLRVERAQSHGCRVVRGMWPVQQLGVCLSSGLSSRTPNFTGPDIVRRSG
jgi:hypothetical protein